MTSVDKARNGAWTPWAQVLCAECEYAALKSNDRAKAYAKRYAAVAAMDRTAEVEQPDGCLVGTCDACRCRCWTRDDVALLQQVGYKSSELDWEGPFGWALQQTGGMCAALVFSAEKREIVVTAMDGEFFVGEYEVAEDESAQCWDTALRMWKSESLYAGDALKDWATLAGMAEACARQVIDFVHRRGVAPAGTGQSCGAANACHLYRGHDGQHEDWRGDKW